MATIQRHSIPADSFAPDKPLNDLLRAQLEHFQEVEKNLPRKLQPSLETNHPPPSPLDSAASSRYIAAMTTTIRQRAATQPAAPGPRLVPKPSRRRRPSDTTIDIAASAPDPTPPAKPPAKPAPPSRRGRKP